MTGHLAAHPCTATTDLTPATRDKVVNFKRKGEAALRNRCASSVWAAEHASDGPMRAGRIGNPPNLCFLHLLASSPMIDVECPAQLTCPDALARRLRAWCSGLGYTIVRPGPLVEEAGGYKALVFDQVGGRCDGCSSVATTQAYIGGGWRAGRPPGLHISGQRATRPCTHANSIYLPCFARLRSALQGNRITQGISCADVADVCLKALHNPEARNKTFEVRVVLFAERAGQWLVAWGKGAAVQCIQHAM